MTQIKLRFHFYFSLWVCALEFRTFCICFIRSIIEVKYFFVLIIMSWILTCKDILVGLIDFRLYLVFTLEVNVNLTYFLWPMNSLNNMFSWAFGISHGYSINLFVTNFNLCYWGIWLSFGFKFMSFGGKLYLWACFFNVDHSPYLVNFLDFNINDLIIIH